MTDPAERDVWARVLRILGRRLPTLGLWPLAAECNGLAALLEAPPDAGEVEAGEGEVSATRLRVEDLLGRAVGEAARVGRAREMAGRAG